MSPFFLYPHCAPALPVLTRAVKQFALRPKCLIFVLNHSQSLKLTKSVVFPWIWLGMPKKHGFDYNTKHDDKSYKVNIQKGTNHAQTIQNR